MMNMNCRLNGPARLMLVSDLDYTLVDHDAPDNLSLLKFNALWESYYRHDSLLVFSTGRSPITYKPLRNQKPLLTPDITIMSVGTEIMYGGGTDMIPDLGWQQFLSHRWDRAIVVEETNQFPQLTPQAEGEQRPHKLDVKIIYSSGIALDVLPKGAGKGKALAYLLKKFKFEEKLPHNTLVCGDSGNDAELFSLPQVYGVMVSNAQEELLQWYEENASDNPNMLHATERCAAGIIQALGHFHLGPNVSPRDFKDFRKCKVEMSSPAHEVVKFFLFYERWRRAEVEKSEEYIQNLKPVFHSSGIFVHPSGVELPIHQCIDSLAGLHGDKQGKQFWTWVDRLSLVQIGSNAWLVKFNKWELCENERQCCLTTVLMSSKAEVPDAFTWLHMHQTWLDGLEIKEQERWLF
ncbi:sucrose-phosphatase 1-like isoform X2 [Malus domestica]|uniref:sucrose-phosphatase 1-like isoform X2 n=1 Tax=Malus domestica TaxID=3750 RepID=UPI0010A9CA90|nr:sucrose-phosphatase 1-like isoform X3 [Malus domestica]